MKEALWTCKELKDNFTSCGNHHAKISNDLEKKNIIKTRKMIKRATRTSKTLTLQQQRKVHLTSTKTITRVETDEVDDDCDLIISEDYTAKGHHVHKENQDITIDNYGGETSSFANDVGNKVNITSTTMMATSRAAKTKYVHNYFGKEA